MRAIQAAMVMAGCLLLAACGKSGGGANGGTAVRTTPPTTAAAEIDRATAACQPVLTSQMSAPSTAHFQPATLVGKSPTGWTVTGTVDLQNDTGIVERQRWVCLFDPTAAKAWAFTEGVWNDPRPTTRPITSAIEVPAACDAAVRMLHSSGEERIAMDCPSLTVMTFALQRTASPNESLLGAHDALYYLCNGPPSPTRLLCNTGYDQ